MPSHRRGNRGRPVSSQLKLAGHKKTPIGHTWHHHQGGTTMQLVPHDVHAQASLRAALNQGHDEMMIEDAGPKIRIEDVDALEKEIHARLASEYRQFLLEYNGGAPSPETVDVPGAPGTPTDVQVFFGIGRSLDSSNLSWNVSLVADRCPGLPVLPIACDSGGNLFCLRIERGVAERVVYCDLESRECVIYAVAQSFGELIRRLRSYRH
jgi:hypothetical protein